MVVVVVVVARSSIFTARVGLDLQVRAVGETCVCVCVCVWREVEMGRPVVRPVKWNIYVWKQTVFYRWSEVYGRLKGVYEGMKEGEKEGVKEGRKEGGKGGKKEGRKRGRKEGRKEGHIALKSDTPFKFPPSVVWGQGFVKSQQERKEREREQKIKMMSRIG